MVTCREYMAVLGKYNIKLDLKVIGWEGAVCSDLSQDILNWRTGVKEIMKM
jgi:hypothetical protein